MPFVMVTDLVVEPRPRTHTLVDAAEGTYHDYTFPPGKAIPVPSEHAQCLLDNPHFRVEEIREAPAAAPKRGR